MGFFDLVIFLCFFFVDVIVYFVFVNLKLWFRFVFMYKFELINVVIINLLLEFRGSNCSLNCGKFISEVIIVGNWEFYFGFNCFIINKDRISFRF